MADFLAVTNYNTGKRVLVNTSYIENIIETDKKVGSKNLCRIDYRGNTDGYIFVLEDIDALILRLGDHALL